jgi:hypothetical protein
MANPIKVLKSSMKVINAAKKTTTKKTAKERGFKKDKASRKEMKQQDVGYGKIFKQDLKSGQVGAAYSTVSKSRSASKPKVPVKRRAK